MRYADGLSLAPSPLEDAEYRVEESIVVIREIDPVGILIEELLVEGQGIPLQGEPAVQGAQDLVDIDLFLHRIPQVTLIRSEAERLAGQTDTAGREHGPNRAQQQEYTEDKNQYLPRLHSEYN